MDFHTQTRGWGAKKPTQTNNKQTKTTNHYFTKPILKNIFSKTIAFIKDPPQHHF